MTTSCAAVTELWARGFNSLPYPRKADLTGGETQVDTAWTLATDGEVDPAAMESLVAGLSQALGQPPAAIGEPGAHCMALAVKPGTVATDAPEGVARQGYRLEISPDTVAITGNAAPGLFYGVQTLLQLLRRTPCGNRLQLPLGVIEDWPDRELRMIHYDTKHHQDRLEAVKDIISRAAGYKINAVAWEIEDKFAYRRHPAIGAPGAFSPEQMQEITAHALKHHVEIIPILQGPSHLAFILKHEEFAHLREDPANNYMLCPSNDECYELLFSMYDELIAATPGCRYFHVGTDEPYFLGDGVECGCRARRDEIGAGGMMAEFIERCTEYLTARGRTVMCWGEWPMRAPDVPRLPTGIINCVYQNDEMSEAYRRKGIREVLYCPTQGARPIFPDYFYPPKPDASGQCRVDMLSERIRRHPLRKFDPLGTIIAAWDDSGLHVETFWMGWVLGSSWGWNPEGPGKEESVAQFCRAFHGHEAIRMPAAYRALDKLARFWTNSWDQAPSKRGPSYKRQWHPRHDRVISLPSVPDPDNLDNRPHFRRTYGQLLTEAAAMKDVLGRAREILAENLGRTNRNRYSLEVFLSVAAIFGDFIAMLEALAEAETRLDAAREHVGNVKFKQAGAELDAAVELVRGYVADREEMFKALTATWEKGRYPKGRSVDGRDFVHIQDDTKDHHADWTVDLGYLIKPSRDLDLEAWADSLEKVAAEFRRLHPDAGRKWQPGEWFMEDG
jgi:hypothetical protein